MAENTVVGSGLSGGGGVSQDMSVQKRQAAIAQELEDDYQARYRPIERKLLNYSEDTGQITKQANAARDTAGVVFDSGNGSVQRSLAGFGASMTPEQKAAHNRMRTISRNGAQIIAGNSVREAVSNRLDNIGTNMMNIGRQAQGAGLQGMNQAAGLEAQRNQAAIQQAAQQKGDNYRMMGTAIGVVGGIAMMASDRNLKENIKPRDDQQDMDDVRSFVNYEWDYKPGQGGWRDDKGHIGGMAQEMPESMSDGRQVDIGDAIMVALGAIRNMDRRMQRIEDALLAGDK